MQVLIEWMIRSSLLIAVGAALLWVSRASDASARLAAWTAMLAASAAIPFLGLTMPRFTVVTPRAVEHAIDPPVEAPVFRTDAPRLETAEPVAGAAPERSKRAANSASRNRDAGQSVVGSRWPNLNWMDAGALVYAGIAAALLLRVIAGLLVTLRLLRRSRATEAAGIRECDRVGAPVTLGVLRPQVVLPVDWREWDELRLEAVLAHERSHIRRFDPLVQLLSAIHRAILWASPLSWLVHSRIVRSAEDASDDAAILAINNRECYAETLLGFMQRGMWRSGFAVPMARHGEPRKRIDRILDSTTLSRGLTWRSGVAIAAIASPLAYVAAVAQTKPAFDAAVVEVSPRSVWV